MLHTSNTTHSPCVPQAVSEDSMADLVHFLHTGQADRPHSARIVQPPEGMTVSPCTVF